ncbi:hypothetical protein RB195_014197 [Necator americanus]|uniref:Uncharacterized protein n=1 Tax=Necator americanus TaxID=51031 RepID=A0ABR1E0L1_NECAM
MSRGRVPSFFSVFIGSSAVKRKDFKSCDSPASVSATEPFRIKNWRIIAKYKYKKKNFLCVSAHLRNFFLLWTVGCSGLAISDITSVSSGCDRSGAVN